ncbi:Homeobox protein HD-8 [Nosema bombycis CQ1]|uniref:Homeobox protein HD-8 n=1 Tax=Nosema bombycis (strain CQ1 / CVCC 102059) TaxID=578461 RepID=R0KS55_NOSB1|nr:Homeobox protein HD-8 [Nosema bombycis CQ1]|eukprot:EOB13042.1 Homeobox protein HD-8 [Nosema bombycis CQ1]
MDKDILKRESEIQAYLGLVKLKKRREETQKEISKYRKTPLQIKVLSEIFRMTEFPSTQTKMDLSLLIDLPIQTVQVWFQNERRNKRRKLRKEGKNISNDTESLFEISILTLVEIVKFCKKNLGYSQKDNSFF